MSTEVPFWVYPALIAVAVLGIIALIAKLILRRKAQQKIEASIAAIAYDILKDVLVPNGMGGHLHVPYLLLTERGLLVIDLLDIPGAIFGGDQMIQWTSIGRKSRYTFANPQHLLYDRMAAVKLLADEVPVDGRLVFTLRGEFPKGRPRAVLRIDELDDEYPVVDRLRSNVAGAFNDVWQNIRRHVKPNPEAA